jgi:dolichyl-phosphate-mannose-protein mannosyltransferase
MAGVTSDLSIGQPPDQDSGRSTDGASGAAASDLPGTGLPTPRGRVARGAGGRGGFVERGLTWMRPRGGRPPLRERLVPPMPVERWWVGWGAPLVVTAIAGFMRFWRLGQPNSIVFDETYYAKDAWTLWKYGYEHNWVDPSVANPALTAHPQQFKLGAGPELVVHPPLGKYMIGVGEHLFGMTPFGWRFTVALLGTLSVLMICRIARRMTRSTLLGCVAGLLLTFDGLEFVMSRISLLDLIEMFWILAAFGALVVDRDKVRQKLVDWRLTQPDGPLPEKQRGPRLGWRWWRLLAGFCLGCACATKWNGLFALCVFFVMMLLWDRGARRAVGLRKPTRALLRKDFWPGVLALPVLSVLVYFAAWSGWFATKGGYFRQWGKQNPPVGFSWIPSPLRHTLASWVPDALRSFGHYEYWVYNFNANLNTYHPYQSNPWSWLVMGRPVSYYFSSVPASCKTNCKDAAVLALGTPTLWWIGTACLVYLIWRWGFRRDWRAGAVLAGMGATWLPWLNYSARTIFEFYAVAIAPFMVLAVTLTIGVLLGNQGEWRTVSSQPGETRAVTGGTFGLAAVAGRVFHRRAAEPRLLYTDTVSPMRRMWGAVAAGVIVLSVIVAFIYFYPIYTAQPLTYNQWHARIWLSSWF